MENKNYEEIQYGNVKQLYLGMTKKKITLRY